MDIKSLGENAVLGALKRIEGQSINKSDNWSDTYPFDNYDDFVDFPDATPPK